MLTFGTENRENCRCLGDRARSVASDRPLQGSTEPPAGAAGRHHRKEDAKVADDAANRARTAELDRALPQYCSWITADLLAIPN